jgi:hypothetical protein
MKLKVVLLTLCFCSLSFGQNEGDRCALCAPRESRGAIGLRVSNTFNEYRRERYHTGEINYRMPFSKLNHIEFGAHFAAYTDMDLAPPGYHSPGTYDATVIEYGAVVSWLWVRNICGGFSWFAGPSVGAGRWQWPIWMPHSTPANLNHWEKRDEESWYVGMGPYIGFEFRPKKHFAMSIDFRPMAVWHGELTVLGWWGLGYCAKYTF